MKAKVCQTSVLKFLLSLGDISFFLSSRSEKHYHMAAKCPHALSCEPLLTVLDLKVI